MCVAKECEFHKDAAPLPHEERISGMRPNHPGFDNDLDLSSVLKHLNSTSLLRSCGTPNVHWVSDAHPRAHRRLTEKANEGFRFKISSQWWISLVRHHSAVFSSMLFSCRNLLCRSEPFCIASRLSGSCWNNTSRSSSMGWGTSGVNLKDVKGFSEKHAIVT